MSAKALAGQTIIDIALQETGEVDRAYEVAILNGKSLTVDLRAGDTVLTPAYDKTFRNLVQLFSNKMNAPASADTVDFTPGAVIDEGIGFWELENDFIII